MSYRGLKTLLNNFNIFHTHLVNLLQDVVLKPTYLFTPTEGLKIKEYVHQCAQKVCNMQPFKNTCQKLLHPTTDVIQQQIGHP